MDIKSATEKQFKAASRKNGARRGRKASEQTLAVLAMKVGKILSIPDPEDGKRLSTRLRVAGWKAGMKLSMTRDGDDLLVKRVS